MNLIRSFTAHPTSVGESYFEHLGHAFGFGLRMLFAGFACLVHGVLPFMFVRTGSRAISQLNERLSSRAATPARVAGDKRLSHE